MMMHLRRRFVAFQSNESCKGVEGVLIGLRDKIFQQIRNNNADFMEMKQVVSRGLNLHERAMPVFVDLHRLCEQLGGVLWTGLLEFGVGKAHSEGVLDLKGLSEDCVVFEHMVFLIDGLFEQRSLIDVVRDLICKTTSSLI